MITQARLKELLHYDPETGIFTRRQWLSKFIPAGSVANIDDGHGYQAVNVAGKRYAAHRLAWFYMTGQWPKGDIDHINGKPSENRFSNLRDVSRRTNIENWNKNSRKNERTKMGVYPNHKKFSAKITVNRKQIYLGIFESEDEAHDAYVTAKRRLHKGCTI